MQIFIALIIFTILCHVHGPRQSGFEKFLGNETVKKLLEQYSNDEIQTQEALLEKLRDAGIFISFRTLKSYMAEAEIKKCKKENGLLENMEIIDVRQCWSKFDQQNLYVMGNGNNYRKFRIKEKCGETLYLRCVNCEDIHKNNPKSIIANAILREGELDRSHQIIHDLSCKTQPLEEVVSEQMDRAQRRDIYQCSVDVKSIWREGANRAREHDVADELEQDDQSSLSYNYPSWITVRRSYNRRRQQGRAADSNDPFDVPEQLQLTKFGAIKLSLGKSLDENDRWLQLRDHENGILVFMTNIQRRAAKECKIFVADGTFELSPNGFQQIWTILGLVETSKGAEWTPLVMSLMKRRSELAYDAVLARIKELWGTETTSSLERIHSDYEASEIKSLQRAFGEHRVFGCIVHYIRGVSRYIKTHLPILYRENRQKGAIWKWIRRCIALPFLRKNEMQRMWGVLKNFRNEFNGEIRSEMNSLIVYFTNQWISKTSRGNLFTFNKLARTRSTNPIESWHSLIKRDPASVRHATSANVLHYFQQVFSESDERLIKILAGKILPRPRDRTYADIDSKLLNALNEYEEMIDTGEISNEEFAKNTETYLNRISYLLLQMDSKMVSSRKDHKIRERKRKLQSEESLITTTTASRAMQIKQWVRTRKLNKAATTPQSTSSESIEMIDNEENIDPIPSISEDNEHNQDEQVVLIKAFARKEIKIVYNPVNSEFRNNLCDRFEYECPFDINNDNVEPFEFSSQEYGPGDLIEIDADGNCGFRSLAYALTGTVENHVMIRRDVIEFIEDTIYQHNVLNRAGNNWWQLFDSIENLRRHIEKAIDIAADAGDVESWMSNIDVAASAKLFNVNIVREI